MAKFRKKPVVIEAEQFLLDRPLPFFGRGGPCCYEDGRWYVPTREGHSYDLTPGDWVIRGVKGEFYPCGDEIFRQTYEAVEQERG